MVSQADTIRAAVYCAGDDTSGVCPCFDRRVSREDASDAFTVADGDDASYACTVVGLRGSLSQRQACPIKAAPAVCSEHGCSNQLQQLYGTYIRYLLRSIVFLYPAPHSQLVQQLYESLKEYISQYSFLVFLATF